MKADTLEYYFEDPKTCPLEGLIEAATTPWGLVNEKNEILHSFLDKIPSSARVKGKTHKTAVLEGDVVVEKGARVEPFAYLQGPCLVRAGARVRPHAWLRPNTVIGKDCVVGHGCEVKNSLLFDGAKIGTNCFVGDSVLGKGARVGSGTIFGNRRFDQDIIHVYPEGKKISTGTDKFGLVQGEYSRLCTNIAIAPGTLIGKHAWVLLRSLKGVVPPDTLVRKENGKIVFKKKERVMLKHKDASGKV